MSLSVARTATHRVIEELFCRQLTKNEKDQIWVTLSQVAPTPTNALRDFQKFERDFIRLGSQLRELAPHSKCL